MGPPRSTSIPPTTRAARSSSAMARAAASRRRTSWRRPGAALAQGFSVALVEQPYRVAGRRSSPPAHHLDAAWVAVVEDLAAGDLNGLPLVTGGRSAGARVACRTAEVTGAAAVLCLAFPLQPPSRKGKPPGPDRLDELDAVKVPVLVVQGENDRFGMPPPEPSREVVRSTGDHSLRSDPEAVAAAVGDWLRALPRNQGWRPLNLQSRA